MIIPSLKAGPCLEHCLEALTHQPGNESGFEVIVVKDGGEKYEAPRRFRASGFPLRVLDQDHKGPAAARNLGLREARGGIILFLDDDSVPAPNWLAAAAEAWDRLSDADGVGGYTRTEPGDSLVCRVNSDLFNWYLDRHSLSGRRTFLSTCNAGYTKKILERAGGFDERFKRASGEDRDLAARISRMGGRLELDKNILVDHDRDLTPRSYARKHYHYGRAAVELARMHPDVERFSAGDYVNFYASILKKYRGVGRRIAVFALLTLSQVATFAGFLTSRLSRRCA